jgi:hypothetical protein
MKKTVKRMQAVIAFCTELAQRRFQFFGRDETQSANSMPS